MNGEAKKMRFTLPDGGLVWLEWPDSITTEDLELVEEVIALQLGSLRKTLHRRKNAIPKPETGISSKS